MSRTRTVRRGIAKRCPHCGEREIFASRFELLEHCPRCGLIFEREEGYWLGAMVIAMVVTETMFALGLVVSLVVTWPDVPWAWVTVLALATNAAIPILGYPRWKTTWLGVHLAATDPTVGSGALRDALAPDRPDSPAK